MFLDDCKSTTMAWEAEAHRAEAPVWMRHREAAAAISPLSALEQRVVALSLYDHRRTIEPEPVVIRLLASLFGWRSPNRLADQRLEALRRYGILLRHGVGEVPFEEEERLREAGFGNAALAEVRRLIGAGRGTA